MGDSGRISRILCGVTLLLVFPGSATAAGIDPADQWLPSSEGATWTYSWSDSAYAPQPTLERYTQAGRDGRAFTLAWTTAGLGNGEGTVPAAGTMDYSHVDSGLVNLNWAATPPPSRFPILCAQASNCPNSLAGTHFMLIWGAREPAVPEPLLEDMEWTSLGGARNDVSSQNRYLGMERVTVAAYPEGVRAAKVRSDITQGGAIGDPYGSGIRTVWWVRGVGPVKIEFRHTGGEVGRSELISTNLTPVPAPPDENYLPLGAGDRLTYRWRNSKHMRRWSTQRFTVAQVVNSTARVDVESVRGPIRVAGSYVFAVRRGGITNLAVSTRTRTRATFPALGPRSERRSRRRRLLTPFDFMTFGYNPVLPAHPERGDVWRSRRGSRDHRVFGVTGRTKILGTRRVRTPAGRFRALAVSTTLRQRGFRYGSGRRVSYFVPGKGLVKLVFRHRDRSVSVVERVR
ncbi:MAG: hypothetical protein WD844_12810 [Thermoleophilaceae bacterium]